MPHPDGARALALGGVLFACLSCPAFAQQGGPSGNGQAVLPYAEQKYRGNVGTSYLDSDPAQFPTPIKPPKGAPNVLMILLNDVGFGQFSVAGGRVVRSGRS